MIGPILRRGGAFFLRRSFKDDPLYAAVFAEYLHAIASRGFPIEYFVEGGRSRTGRMLAPKAGMLATDASTAALRGIKRPLVFVPVYIGYEQLLEGESYIGRAFGQAQARRSRCWAILTSLKKLQAPLRQGAREYRRAARARALPRPALAGAGTRRARRAPSRSTRPRGTWTVAALATDDRHPHQRGAGGQPGEPDRGRHARRAAPGHGRRAPGAADRPAQATAHRGALFRAPGAHRAWTATR
ncbi:MAG: 1-acyl-sn-glycerol-3-phosphate acyltransferase [Comamonadaceae bacterium]|nr:1-acyl-sn-glycerol-3-phosphate acyltransferase [Comamonadaceae bacterium]